MALSNDFKHNEASFSMISIDLLCLLVAQMPRSTDLVTFMLTDRQTETIATYNSTWKKSYYESANCNNYIISIDVYRQSLLVVHSGIASLHNTCMASIR